MIDKYLIILTTVFSFIRISSMRLFILNDRVDSFRFSMWKEDTIFLKINQTQIKKKIKHDNKKNE